MEKIKCTVETWSKKRQSFDLKSLCGRLALPATAVDYEFFLTKVKRFSEIYFTAKFSSFKLKKRFRMEGEDKNSSHHFFNSRQKFCEVFFTKPLHKGFFAAFCHLPEPCRNRRDTPCVNAKRRQKLMTLSFK